MMSESVSRGPASRQGRLGDMGIADEAAQIVEQRRFFD
jgi:hypothetical protein